MSSGLQGLIGTMTPSAVLTALQAQLQAQQDATSAQAQQAAGAASEAGTAYQNAAAQPSPEVDPMSAFFPTLFSHIAATIARDPSYVTRAHENIKSEQNALLAVRKQTLQALHDNYVQKAEAARQLGNTEAVTEAHAKLVQVQKQIDVVLKSQELAAAGDRVSAQQKGAGERNAATNATTLEAARIRAHATTAAAGKAQQQATEYMSSLEGVTRNGSRFLDLTNVPAKDKAAALTYAKNGNLVPVDKDTKGRLDAAEEVYSNLDDLEKLIGQVLPKTPGQRVFKGPMNALQAASQTGDPALSAWGNTSLAAIRNVQALAAGMGSGFRLNQTEINTIVRNFPKITDTQAVAARKLKFERDFLQNKERTFVTRDWRSGAAPAQPAGQVQRWVSDGKGGFVPASP